MIHCFYHDDLDGHCAGAIVKQKFSDAEMHELNYGYNFKTDVLDKLKPASELEIYIVDFSFTTAEFTTLGKHNIHWCDHHKTGIDEAEMNPDAYEFVRGIQDVSKAGAQLTWEYLYPDTPIPLAVHYVSKWDIWDHSDPRTIPFNRGLQLTETTDPVNDQAMIMWKELFENNREGDNRKWNAVDQVMNIGTIGEAMKAQYDAFIGKAAYYIPNWEGYRTVALNSKVFDSYVIFEHADKWEEHDPEVLVWYHQAANGKWKYSVRAYPGTSTDVIQIAEKYSGGGHAKAAGFIMDELVVYPILEEKKDG